MTHEFWTPTLHSRNFFFGKSIADFGDILTFAGFKGRELGWYLFMVIGQLSDDTNKKYTLIIVEKVLKVAIICQL